MLGGLRVNLYIHVVVLSVRAMKFSTIKSIDNYYV